MELDLPNEKATLDRPFDMARHMALKLASRTFEKLILDEEEARDLKDANSGNFEYATLGVYPGAAADKAAVILESALQAMGFPADTNVISDKLVNSEDREVAVLTSHAVPVPLQQVLMKIAEIQKEQAQGLLH